MLAREGALVPGELALPMGLEMGPIDMREASSAGERGPTNLIAIPSFAVPRAAALPVPRRPRSDRY